MATLRIELTRDGGKTWMVRGEGEFTGTVEQIKASAVRVWRDGTSRLSDLRQSGSGLPPTSGGVLNPEWVEKLMGYPPGYTEIDP